MNLHDNQKSFIKLVERTEDRGDGWKVVGKALEKLSAAQILENPELFDINYEDDTMLVRLSQRGQVLADYL